MKKRGGKLALQPGVLMAIARPILLTALLSLGIGNAFAGPAPAGPTTATADAQLARVHETSRPFPKNAIDDPARWADEFGLAIGCDGRVFAAGAAPDGSIVLGGDFTVCGNVAANRVARWYPDSGVFVPLGVGASNGLNDFVYALAVTSTGAVYVGGVFTQAGGATANRVARFDSGAAPGTGTWTSLGSGAANGVGSVSVRAIAVASSGSVFVGGDFSVAGGAPASGVARFDPDAIPGSGTWSALGSGASNGVAGPVRAIALTPSNSLYVAGLFTQAGGLEANRIARFDPGAAPPAGTWSSLGTGAANGVSSEVYAVAVASSGAVYAGGIFTQAGGATANRVARFDPGASPGTGSWSSLGSGAANGVAGGSVDELAVLPSGAVYVAGGLISAGGVLTKHIARFDPGATPGTGSWSMLGSGTSEGVSGTVLAIAVASGTLYVGGNFTVAGGSPAFNVARFDPGASPGTGNWSSLGSGASNGIDGFGVDVAAVAVDPSGSLFAGGSFGRAGGVATNFVARFDPGAQAGAGAWSPLGSGIANGVDGEVNALAAAPTGAIFAGGNFTEAGGAPANRVARFDPGASPGTGTWSTLGSGPNNGVTGTVLALAVAPSGSVYVGGSFTGAGGNPAIPGIARFDPGTGTWSGLGQGVTGDVYAIAVTASGIVYVGGLFTQAGAVPANNVARFDPGAAPGSEWSSLGAGAMNGVNGVVRAIAIGSTGAVYLGGAFDQAGGAAANRVARFDPAAPGSGTWSTLGSGAQGSDVRALAIASSGSVYVAGSFSQAGGLAAPGIARFDPGAAPGSGTWASLGSGNANGLTGGDFGNGVNGLAVASRSVYAGGFFTRAGDRISLRIARYDDRAATQTTLSANANPAVYSAPLDLTATMTVSAFPPSTGGVSFTHDGDTVANCSAVPVGPGPLSNRSVVCALSSAQRLPVGTHPVIARYSGDALNFVGTSDPLQLVVAPPTILLSPTSAGIADLPTAIVGQGYSQQLTATTNGAATNFQYVISSGFVPGLGVVANTGLLIGSPSQAGTYTFTVTAIDGSPALDGGPFSDTQDYRIVVGKRATTTTIGAISPSPATSGQPYTVPVSVTASGATPDGQVAVNDGLGSSCVATLSNGSGQCSMISSTSGVRTITATYGEQPAYLASTDTETLQVLASSQTSAVVSAADRIGQRDRLVTVPIAIRGDGTTVKFSARMAFDPAQFQSVEVRPVAPASCTRIASNLVEVTTLGSTRTQPLPQIDTPFCDVTFRLVTNPASQIDLSIDPGTTTCQDGGGTSNTCGARNGKILVSSLVTQPNEGTLINIAGYQGQSSETRVLIFSNVGTTPLAVSNCVVSGTGFALVTPPASPIAPGSSGRLLVGCTLDSFPGTRQGGLVQCSTTDVVRASVSFGLSCTTVAQGDQLPGDQVFNNSLKAGDEFGRSTAVSDVGGSAAAPAAKGTGTTQLMVVGAPNAGSDSAGRVFIFEGDLTPKTLRRHAKGATPRGIATRIDLAAMRLSRVLSAPQRPGGKIGIGDKFGSSVAIAPAGDRIAVGAPLAGNGDRGQVLVYDRPPSGWGELGVEDVAVSIDAPPSDGLVSAQEFGAVVTFAPTGELVVGAPGADSIASQDIGVVYYFPVAGQGYGTPQRTGSPNAVANGRFGAALAATDSMLVVGAPQEGAANSQSGAAYMLPIANGLPTAPERFLAAGTGIGDKFGSSVAAAGGLVVVGAANDDVAGPDSGSATVFRSGPLSSAPIEVVTLEPDAGGNQGAGMSVATNGDLILVGAPLSSIDGGANRGRAYVFDVEPQFLTATTPLARRPALEALTNTDGEPNDRFGDAVAINRSIALAGVPLDDRLIESVNVSDVGRADPFALERIFRADFE